MWKNPNLLAYACWLIAGLWPSAIHAAEVSLLPLAQLERQGTQADVAERGEAPDSVRSLSFYPGPQALATVVVTPRLSPLWDLSDYRRVRARLRNTGDASATLWLRVDNPGDWKDEPWNMESVVLAPGQESEVEVEFGLQHGRQPGYALDARRISQLVISAEVSEAPVKVDLLSLDVLGAVREESVGESSPEGGATLRRPLTYRPEVVIGAVGGEPVRFEHGPEVRVSREPGGGVTFDFSQVGSQIRLAPESGTWDWRSAHQLRVRLVNEGESPVIPVIGLESRAGNRKPQASSLMVDPGEETEVVIPFIGERPWRAMAAADGSASRHDPDSGTPFTSDEVTGITFIAQGRSGRQVWRVLSVVADAPPVVLPDWVGARPPVEGDWVVTMDENFDGEAVDLTRWNIYSENYLDPKSHFSRHNVRVVDGVAKMRFEKRRGKHNDAINGEPADYATGHLDTFGKWVQRYGYFEARVRLTGAPGLWPAFWVMPDRGLAAGDVATRISTVRTGMEFDIMEHQSGWGPHRFHVDFHWDGYEEAHQQMGSSSIYTPHDEHGFFVIGLLWLPGMAVIYRNGEEVARLESERVSTLPSYPIFTFPSGGWDGAALDDATLPAEWEIDYVRVWQRQDLASSADGVQYRYPTPEAPR